MKTKKQIELTSTATARAAVPLLAVATAIIPVRMRCRSSSRSRIILKMDHTLTTETFEIPPSFEAGLKDIEEGRVVDLDVALTQPPSAQIPRD